MPKDNPLDSSISFTIGSQTGGEMTTGKKLAIVTGIFFILFFAGMIFWFAYTSHQEDSKQNSTQNPKPNPDPNSNSKNNTH